MTERAHVETVPAAPVAQWQAWWRALSTADDRTAAAARSGFVLSSRELEALGVSRQTARTAVRSGRWASAGRGFVAPADLTDPSSLVEQRRRHAVNAAGAARARPRLGVSGRSAAILHGLPTLFVPAQPELTATASSDVGGGRRPGRHVYRAQLVARELTQWYGIPLTTVERTIVDLARHNARDGVMAADAALREDLSSVPELRRALARARGWPGVRQARDVIAIAAPLAESPLESITRLALVSDGFPTPELQVSIGGYRVDMLFRDRKLIIEADGRGKYTDDELWREKLREHHLRALGFRIERVIWDDVIRRWETTRRRLWVAYRLIT